MLWFFKLFLGWTTCSCSTNCLLNGFGSSIMWCFCFIHWFSYEQNCWNPKVDDESPKCWWRKRLPSAAGWIDVHSDGGGAIAECFATETGQVAGRPIGHEFRRTQIANAPNPCNARLTGFGIGPILRNGQWLKNARRKVFIDLSICFYAINGSRLIDPRRSGPCPFLALFGIQEQLIRGCATEIRTGNDQLSILLGQVWGKSWLEHVETLLYVHTY